MGLPPVSQTSPAPAANPPAPPAPKANAVLEDPPVTWVQKDNVDLVSARVVSLAVTAAVAPALGAFIVGPSLLAQAAAPPAAADNPKTFPASDLTSRDGVSAWLSRVADAADDRAFSEAFTLHVGHGPTVEDALKLRAMQIHTTLDTLNTPTHGFIDESRDVGEPPKP
jgi:hypothetical protein